MLHLPKPSVIHRLAAQPRGACFVKEAHEFVVLPVMQFFEDHVCWCRVVLTAGIGDLEQNELKERRGSSHVATYFVRYASIPVQKAIKLLTALLSMQRANSSHLEVGFKEGLQALLLLLLHKEGLLSALPDAQRTVRARAHTHVTRAAHRQAPDLIWKSHTF